MSDRRRINGPASGTQPATFHNKQAFLAKPYRTRKPNELRKIFLQTGLVPAANGSAYLELAAPVSKQHSFIPTTSTIKLSCTIYGPKPLPRTAPFSPNLQLNASVKFAPFASRIRRGYIRDNVERDLGGHLENALRGVIIPERWPKSALDVSVMVLEGEEDCLWNVERGVERGVGGVGLMNVLAGCVNVAVAALCDARIDCLDVLAAGVAARVEGESEDVLDPCPSEHEEISASCVVGYLPARDEVVEVWSRAGQTNSTFDNFEALVSSAIRAARGANRILKEVVAENVQTAVQREKDVAAKIGAHDVDMKT